MITQSAVSYGIAMATEQEIDEINILQATFLAMQRALDKLAVKPDLALIDGNRAKDFGLPVRTIVKGDSLSSSIAAASILAKVTRDRLMEQLDAQYPQCGFAVHKGLRHQAALCCAARVWSVRDSPADVSQKAPWRLRQSSVRGARRWRRSIFAGAAIILSRPTTAAATAIDIIAENAEYLVFAEVKLRRTAHFGAAREFVNLHKQEGVCATASMFLEEHETALQPRFDVVEIYAPDGLQSRHPYLRQIEDAFYEI